MSIAQTLTGPAPTQEQLFAAWNGLSKAEMIGLFPTYVQEQHNLRVLNKKNITKSVDLEGFTMKTPFGDQVLLKSTDLKLEANKRQGLIGANATGKTLLFSNMNENKIKDFPKHIHIHHCKELETHELSESVLDTVVNSHPYRNILLKVEAKLKSILSADPKPAGDNLIALKDNLEYVQMALNSIRSADAVDRATKMLRVLGFDDFGLKKPCVALSGGLRMRVALAMAFFIEADLLLLDEPTNHLDFPSVLWLENRLRGYKGSFLLVSHDRELLNNVCTSIMLIEDKQIHYYAMGFKEFEKKKAAEDKKKNDDIDKFLAKNTNADPSTLLGKQKAEKQEWSRGYQAKMIALAGKFTFPAPVKLDNTEKGTDGNLVAADDISVINLKDVTFSYDVATGVYIFKDPISFNVTATTRVGVMGPNGAGKSTLLKLLTHKLTPCSGTVVHHPKFTLAYFGQHSTAELDLEKTPNEFMQLQFPNENAGALRNHLAKTGVTGTLADTRMMRLSFSQRSCVVFSKLTFVCPHLLIMDEPTNFLDLESVDSLISACNKYKGALLLVSHNRDFLRKCAKQYLSVVPGHFNLYDNLKTAEQATYSFIAEMEEGISGVSKSALANNPGGGTVHSSQKAGGGDDVKSATDGVKSISISSTPSVARPAAAAAAAFAVGEKVQALWSDGKFYEAIVKKVDGAKFTITYTAYGNNAILPASSLKKAAPAPAGKAPAAGAKGAAAPKKK